VSPLHVLALVADCELVGARVASSAGELDQRLVEIATTRWREADQGARGEFTSAPADADQALEYLERDQGDLLALWGTTEGWA
jgi:hypothetical protein